MPDSTRRSGGPRRGIGATAMLAALSALVAVAVVFPFLMVVAAIVRGVASGGIGPAIAAASIDTASAVLLLRTVRTALVIGIVSTAIAWPAAWVLRGRRGGWTGLMLAPMLMPSYLAYSGWGLLRSPGTWTGDFISAAHPPPWSTEPGYWPLLVGDVLAIGGLCLWAWPLAGVILAHGFSRLDASALEALRMEPGSVWRKRLCILGMGRGSAFLAVLAVALVMLGSAVPLHLTQMRTWAVHLWLTLDQTPVDQHWAAWLGAWPLLGVAGAAGMGIASRMAGDARAGQAASSQPARTDRLSGGSVVVAVAVWMSAVVAPGVLFGWFVPNLRALHTFWHVHHEPIETSLGLGAGVAGLGMAVTAAIWLGLSGGGRARGLAVVCIAVLLVSGLVPGVFVGSAVAAAWNTWSGTRWMGDSALIVVLGHLARFGFVPALVGAMLAKAEPPEERDSRRLDGAEGARGWLRACLPAGLGTLAAAGLVAGVLSFHEIESAVILQPPGLDSFSRQMLGFLHYSRMQELSAGALLTMMVGVLGGGLALAFHITGGLWRWK